LDRERVIGLLTPIKSTYCTYKTLTTGLGLDINWQVNHTIAAMEAHPSSN